MLELYALRFSHFKASASSEARARKVKLKEEYGFSTTEADISKQWRSRAREAVVIEIFFCTKS